jgi:predicted DsbA family dithiol-disulfide isomerase
VVFPWCHTGKRRFEKAAASFGDPVEVAWRGDELDPRPTPVREVSSVEGMLARTG